MKRLFVLSLLVIAIAYSCKHDPFPYNGPETPGIPILPGDTCDENKVYFNEVEAIIKANCSVSGCHDGTNPEAYSLLTHQAIVDSALKESDITDWDGSDLYERLVKEADDPDEAMPPPPLDPLEPELIELIKKWVEQGATDEICGGCDTLDVRYTTHIAPMIDISCKSCHNSSPTSISRDFTNYQEAVKYADSMLIRMNLNEGEQGYMPSGRPKNDCNINLIRIWIENGTPN